MALNNVSFLVADDDMSCQDVILGHSILLHFEIDSCTLSLEDSERDETERAEIETML